jgi:hypothetical protein
MKNIPTYQKLMDAGLACGETAGILDSAYLRQAHQRRQRLIEAATSSELDGRPTSPERLFAFLGDVPVQASRHLFGEEHAAQLFHALTNPGASELGREALGLIGDAEASGDGLLSNTVTLLRRGEGNTAATRLALTLMVRKALGPAEPALSGFLHGLQAAMQRSTGAVEDFLSMAIYKASLQSRDNARTLRAAVVSSLIALKDDRADSGIHAIAALLLAGHPLTYGAAAAKLDMSRAAAVEHITRLVNLGLVEPATRRKTGQAFIARDGVLTFQPPAPPPSRNKGQDWRPSGAKLPLPIPLTEEQRARIEAVSDDVASRIEDLDRLLRRFEKSPEIED